MLKDSNGGARRFNIVAAEEAGHLAGGLSHMATPPDTYTVLAYRRPVREEKDLCAYPLLREGKLPTIEVAEHDVYTPAALMLRHLLGPRIQVHPWLVGSLRVAHGPDTLLVIYQVTGTVQLAEGAAFLHWNLAAPTPDSLPPETRELLLTLRQQGLIPGGKGLTEWPEDRIRRAG